MRWTAAATSELDDIFQYLLDHSPKSAERVSRRIIDRAESLGEFPFKGEKMRTAGARKLTVTKYRYVIVYRIFQASDEVQILNVRHTVRKPSPTAG